MTQTERTPSALEELTQAIVKAVPELTKRHKKHMKCMYSTACNCTLDDLKVSPLKDSVVLGLEDVLLTLIMYVDSKHHPHNPGVRDLQYRKGTAAILSHWTLGKPLSEQSPETISFLHSLLCETK